MRSSIPALRWAAAIAAPIAAIAMAGAAAPAWAATTYVFDVTNYAPTPALDPNDFGPGTVLTMHQAPVPSSFSFSVTLGAVTFQSGIAPNLYLLDYYDVTYTAVPGLDQALATAGLAASQLAPTFDVVQGALDPSTAADIAQFQVSAHNADLSEAVLLNFTSGRAPLPAPFGSPLAPFTPQQLAVMFAHAGPFTLDVTGDTEVFAGSDSHLVLDLTSYEGTAVFDAAASGFAVPEPAAWALMLTGFGLAGAALRRYRRGGALA